MAQIQECRLLVDMNHCHDIRRFQHFLQIHHSSLPIQILSWKRDHSRVKQSLAYPTAQLLAQQEWQSL
eukprot:9229088-Ditylum_brightwellii.AAC.1